MCASCVPWGSAVSRFVLFNCGVRQGGVLLPHLFAIYIDNVIKEISNSKLKYCCEIKFRPTCVSVFMYADGLLLLSPLIVTYLQSIIRIAKDELAIFLELSKNASKSTCVRIGARYNANCADIITCTMIMLIKRYLEV